MSVNERLLLLVNQDWANPWLDQLFTLLSSRPLFALPLALALFALCWCKRGRQGIRIWLLMALVIGSGDFIGNQLKQISQQARPCYDLAQKVRLPGRPAGSACGPALTGWPSNHTLNFFAMAAFLSVLLLRLPGGLLLFAIATLVGLSRIYLGKHYPDQVAAGALIGLSWGLVWALLVRRYDRLGKPADNLPQDDRTAP